jgi:hypothetical protein
MTKCGKMEFRMHGFDAPPPPNPPGGLPEKNSPYGYFCKGSKFRKIHIQCILVKVSTQLNTKLSLDIFI